MTDDRDKPRRARTHAGDDERAMIGAKHRRTPASGIPVEVDPEVTPPPGPVPSPAELVEGYTSIPRPTRESIELQGRAIENLTAAVGKVWDARNDAEALARVEHLTSSQSARIDKLIEGISQTHATVDQFLMPAVKMMQGQLASLVSAHEQSRVKVTQFWDSEWPRAVKTLGEIGPRIDKVERTQEMQGFQLAALTSSINGLSGQFQGVTMLASELEKRVILLERDMADRKAGQQAASLIDVDVTARVAALEKLRDDAALVTKANRWWIAKLFALCSVLIGAAAAGAKYLFNLVSGH